MDLSAKDVMEAQACSSAAFWSELHEIKLQGGVWSFKDHPYLKEIMEIPRLQRLGKAPLRMCAMKATQLGYTESMVLIVLHGQIHGHYPKGVLYLFPSNVEVREFSKARFTPLILLNKDAIGKYVKNVESNKGVDTTNLKSINGSMLYLRGARLSLHLEAGNKEGPQLRSIPADTIIFDELDMMDFEDVVVKAEGRLGRSNVGTSFYISNPTLPDRGISSLYSKSDQRKWHRKCGCGGWTCAEEEFPDLIGRDSDGKGYIAYKKCGKPTNYRLGEWVAAQRDNSDYMWGYQLSQLASDVPRNDPLLILKEYNDPPNGNLGDVIRLRLGKPFISAEDTLTSQQVLALCSNVRLQADSHKGPCAMGVDVRSHKNIVIGYRSGKNRYSIVRVARVKDWEDILRMAHRFNVRSCVVDIRPYEDSARQFQKNMKCKTWLCEYKESLPGGTVYHDATGVVKVARTEIMDATHRWIADEECLSLPSDCPEIRQFAIECTNCAKCEVVDKRTKQVMYRYMKLRDDQPDDYRHALNYFYLAVMGGHLPVVGDEFRRQRVAHAVCEYARN